MDKLVGRGVKTAVIGGSAFYAMDGLEEIEEVQIDTPFGRPSDVIIIGKLSGQKIAFLPRHGVGHYLLPSELPSLANIYALKAIGVEFIISVSAVGSLRDDIEPLHFVVPDQVIDRTQGRPSSFFGRGLVAHVPFADPFCSTLQRILVDAANSVGVTSHDGGTYVVIEGPQFSTRAESELYRSWGGDVVGMTALPEAKLAREAEMCYAILATASDYDCWHPKEESVTGGMVVANLNKNVGVSKEILCQALTTLPSKRSCSCNHALEDALITPIELVPKETIEMLEPIISKYVSPSSASGQS